MLNDALRESATHRRRLTENFGQSAHQKETIRSAKSRPPENAAAGVRRNRYRFHEEIRETSAYRALPISSHLPGPAGKSGVQETLIQKIGLNVARRSGYECGRTEFMSSRRHESFGWAAG